jgi:hypothetical protein
MGEPEPGRGPAKGVEVVDGDTPRRAQGEQPELGTAVGEDEACEPETAAPPTTSQREAKKPARVVRFAEPEPKREQRSNLAELLDDRLSNGPDPDEDDDEYIPAGEEEDGEDEEGGDLSDEINDEEGEASEGADAEKEEVEEDEEDEEEEDGQEEGVDGEDDGGAGEEEKESAGTTDGDAGAALAATFSSLPKGVLGTLIAQGKLGAKPLHAAAAANDATRVRSLLAEDGDAEDVDGRDAFDYTALHVACESGADAAIAALLECGADREAATRMHASRPLHYACFEGRVGACRLLLGAGAEVDARTDDLRTPLFQAAFRGHASCVRELLAAGADTGVQAHDGRGPTDVAATGEIRELLLLQEHQPPAKRRRADPVV